MVSSRNVGIHIKVINGKQTYHRKPRWTTHIFHNKSINFTNCGHAYATCFRSFFWKGRNYVY